MQNQQISSDLIRGHIDTIILHTLLDGDKYAEQISDTIDKKSDNAYKINQATLYSALKRLESSKFVKSYQKDANGNGRRKFFTLTENGKNFAKDNLSNWSYSRAIIDKLIDCAPQPIVKTEYIEKIVHIPVERTIIQEVEKTVEKPDLNNEITSQPTSNNNLVSNETKKQPDDVQEVNFRNILNGLIKATTIQNEEKQEAIELSPLNKDDIVEEIKDFNQTISQKSDSSSAMEITEIDFSDLVSKSRKEGYKISISSKNSTKPTGKLLKNKLNLYTSLAMFLILSLEILFYTSTYKALLNLSTALILGLVGVCMLWPVINLILYKKAPLQTTPKDVYVDSILTTLIVVFNLLLINFAGTMLFNLDFSSKIDVILYLAIPATIYIDIVIYSVVRYYFAKLKLFKVN